MDARNAPHVMSLADGMPAPSRWTGALRLPHADRRLLTTVWAADFLSLAAAPTFAVMALLTAILGDGMPNMLCSAMQSASPFGGMVPMYALMSAFHMAPWLRLIANRRSRVVQC